ncbi:hypothetical protein AMJ57_02555 [Parcubacteria bacterium SG8_24]|nr:MAG: hypothetical protein AMJ57_02555 [Parcubacteria bacterium SG8_24]
MSRIEVVSLDRLNRHDVICCTNLVFGSVDVQHPGVVIFDWTNNRSGEGMVLVADEPDTSRAAARFMVEDIMQAHGDRQYHQEGFHVVHIWARRLKADDTYDPYGELILIITGGRFEFGQPPCVDFPTVEKVGWVDSMRTKSWPLIGP